MVYILLSAIDILVQIFSLVLPGWILLRDYKDKDINQVAITSYMYGVFYTGTALVVTSLINIINNIVGGGT